MQKDAYIPGVCNINYEEIAYRKKSAKLGAALFVILLAAMLALGLGRWVRLALFVPAFLAAISYLQAKHKFCVAYGAAGVQNATEGSKSASAITDKAALAKDKARTRQLNAQAVGFAALATGLALLLPV
jgi:hypothetical protein